MYNIAFIMKSNLRRHVLELVQKPKTAKMISKELRKHIQSISRTLIEMEKKNMVKCVNPKDDRFRFYQITTKGESVLKKVKEIEGN